MTGLVTRVAGGWPFLIPPAYLAVILFLQPAGHLGDPETTLPLGRLLYDDYDMTAFVLRGLNGLTDRTPGDPHPPPLDSADFRDALDFSAHLRPHYFLEYPAAVLPLFMVGWIVQPGEDKLTVPAAVLDAWHNNIVGHWPRNDREQLLWRQFRRAIQVTMILMTLCLLGLMAVLRLGYLPQGGLAGPIVLVILPAALYFALNRFDVVPTLLVALSLACLGRRWIIASAFLLATATLLKVYPILLAPLFFRYLSNEWRRCLAWTAVYGGTIVVLFLPPLLAWGAATTWAPYRFQLSRPPEFGWTLYGVVLPEGLARNSPLASLVRLGSVALVGLALFWTRPPELTGLLRRGAVVLMVFVALQVFYSPQWIIWFSPLLIPLARVQPSVGWLAVALDLVTYLSFPVVYDLVDPSPTRDVLRIGLICARCVLLMSLAVVLLAAEMRAEDISASPAHELLGQKL